MRILTIDVGKNSGAALCVDGEIKSSTHFKFESHKQYYDHVCKLINHSKPEVIGTAKPSRFYNTIFSHAQMISLIQLAAEERGISVFLPFDREFKSWAFQKQKKITKQDVIEKFGGSTDDEGDARMFAMYLDANLVEEK